MEKYAEVSWNILLRFEIIFIFKKVYLLFEFINVQDDLDSDLENPNCLFNYISISSFSQKNNFYKICGKREQTKIITTYNDVLINLVVDAVNDLSTGFYLNYKIINNPEECKKSLFKKVAIQIILK